MGVCWEIVCHDCKSMVDLNKNRTLPALWHGYSLGQKEPSHYDLVAPVLFMRRHWGHKVDLKSDCDDDYGYLWGSYKQEDVYRPKEQT